MRISVEEGETLVLVGLKVHKIGECDLASWGRDYDAVEISPARIIDYRRGNLVDCSLIEKDVKKIKGLEALQDWAACVY